MQWSSLVTAGHLVWHLNHRHLIQEMSGQGVRLNQATPAALKAGKLVINDREIGLAQPIMTLLPAAAKGQWWWASSAATEESSTISAMLRDSAGECDVINTPTLGFSALTGVQNASPGQAAEVVCSAATALTEGPFFTAIPMGKSLVVSAVQVNEIKHPDITEEQITSIASSVKWTPAPVQREVSGARHTAGILI